ncbi:SRPBCC family protein [Nocardia sp. NPDC058058]|uniref:SRPBCC family protein n=1 Tax=Nocardia sp. NPDC058058 TaxID=3346317 RepID=UPI0036DA5753
MVARTMTVSESILIPADPLALYERISDPTQMGGWSPENRGATVAEPRESAYVGMMFVGHNKRGIARWTTRCTVTAADPGERFAFRVHAIGLRTPSLRGPIANWEYRFEPEAGGTRVTETWNDDRTGWPDSVAAVFDRIVTSGKSFADFQRGNIHVTLRNLQRILGAPA